MNNQTTEVLLTVNLRGSQAIHGSYQHFHKVTKEGNDVLGLRTETPVTFSDCSKVVHLGEQFIKASLAEPPKSLKDRIRGNRWKGLTEEKRIALHVNAYVVALHPEHRGYDLQIL